MIDVSRRISESDRRLRRERGFSREDVMGHELRGKTVGLLASATSEGASPSSPARSA
jgi:phosphoglycerate dehydrogenase-like enzyme